MKTDTKRFASRNHKRVVTWLSRKGLHRAPDGWRNASGKLAGGLQYKSGVWQGQAVLDAVEAA